MLGNLIDKIGLVVLANTLPLAIVILVFCPIALFFLIYLLFKANETEKIKVQVELERSERLERARKELIPSKYKPILQEIAVLPQESYSNLLTLHEAKKILDNLRIDNEYTNFRYGDKTKPQAIRIIEKPISRYLKPRKHGLAVKRNTNGRWEIEKRLYSKEDLEEYISDKKLA